MFKFDVRFLVLAMLTVLVACSQEEPEQTATKVEEEKVETKFPEYPLSTLPQGLVWETNEQAPVYASGEARKGGMITTYLTSFPLTFRVVGPDANTSYRSIILKNHMALTALHPETGELIPQMATHWAYGEDGSTVFYKLNPDAKWSDGESVTADDYMFALEFNRSEHIVAPWYNNHYTKEILDVRKYDDYTISITGATAKPKIDLHYYYSVRPIPRHFHILNENWVTDYNWKIEPNTGPYMISDVKKGKSLTLSRKKDWWAKDHRYNKNRFNVDKIRIEVIRDDDIAFQHFLRGQLDVYSLAAPKFWHEKATGEMFDKGYIHKIWFYNDKPRGPFGFYLNQDKEVFKDKRVRYGLSHSLNIAGMISSVMRGDYQRLQSFHVGYGEYSNTDIRARQFDLNKAEQYLNEAGWDKRGEDGIRMKDGSRLSVRITYGSQLHTDKLVYLKEEAKKAGIELVLETLDAASFFRKITEKTYDIMFMGFGTGLRPAYWQHFHSENANKTGTNNITNTADPDMDSKIMRFRESTDAQERKNLAREMQQMIHEQGAFIPAYLAPYTRSAYWRWIKLPDFYSTKTGASVLGMFGDTGGLFWIDEDMKKETLEARKKDINFDPVTIIDDTHKTD